MWVLHQRDAIRRIRKGRLMSVVKLLADDELAPAAAEVFADIRKTRGTAFVNNFWRALAHDPALLKRTWESVKQVMGKGALDPLVKELLYIAVSTTQGCEYCVRSHTAAARAKGMTPEMHMELAAVIGMAAETNRLATVFQVPVDEAFLAQG
jgi:AhpD family alkylhydroperoxidase